MRGESLRTDHAQAVHPIFYGWWIVAVSLVIDACKHGTFNRCLTLYILPIRNELGLSVTAISLAEMLGWLEGGVLGPVMGYLTDRFGAGAILVFGGRCRGWVLFSCLRLTISLSLCAFLSVCSP